MYRVKTGDPKPILCTTIAAIQDALRNLKEQHVSIEWRVNPEVTKIFHVSVDSHGNVFDSYGAEAEFDFKKLITVGS